ncbi:MAG: DUF1214 domain-containing protein [Halioglobus sp.]|nr:DUF1214 domain-containing protein [Halioglobus sp.]
MKHDASGRHELTRREVLARAGLAAVTAAGTSISTAGAETTGGIGDSGASTADQALLSGKAWQEFCDQLREVGNQLLGDDFPQSERDRMEGFRYLTHLLSFSMQMEIESGNTSYPAFTRYEQPHNQWGGPNPDNTYLRAHIDPDKTYRVWGNLKGIRQAILSLHEGDLQQEKFGVYSEQSLHDWDVGADGEFELWVSKDRHSGNWMPMHDKARIFGIRVYQSDWEKDASPAFHIECIDTGRVSPPPMAPGELAAGLERSIHWIKDSVTYWNTRTKQGWARAEKNTVAPAVSVPGGADNMIYGKCYWDLREDEALVLTGEVPDAEFWNYCIHTQAWLQSGDMANRQVSLNGHQMYIDQDGRYRLVLSARDPGTPNWIDSESRPTGLLVYRYVWSKSSPTPQARKVKVDDVRSSLPPDHPTIDADERNRRLSRRRELYWNRYL